MRLTSLTVSHVRRLRQVAIEPAANWNLILGANGSGKTSLLEAVHLLATARSFRTSRITNVIEFGEPSITVHGGLLDRDGVERRLGITRDSGSTRIRLDGQNIHVASQLARLLPVLVFNSESYLLLDGGPSMRRGLLDRLLFHVEHDYLSTLKQFFRALKQRNAALRTNRSLTEISAFDEHLCSGAEKIDHWRRTTVETINEILATWASALLPGRISLEYRSGWPADQSLQETLLKNESRDRSQGTTSAGPHRGEIRIKFDEKLAKSVVSRGQGKLIITSIIAAQARYLSTVGEIHPVLLVDDLPSELDWDARSRAIELFAALDGQIFFTAINEQDMPRELVSKAKLFHVEQGSVTTDADERIPMGE